MIAVRKSLRTGVAECSIIDSCNLKLDEPVGQGTREEFKQTKLASMMREWEEKG